MRGRGFQGEREGVQPAQPPWPRERRAFAQGPSGRRHHRTGPHPGFRHSGSHDTGCTLTQHGGHFATQMGSSESQGPPPSRRQRPPGPGLALHSGLGSQRGWWLSLGWVHPPPAPHHLPSTMHCPACPGDTGHLHSFPPGVWRKAKLVLKSPPPPSF